MTRPVPSTGSAARPFGSCARRWLPRLLLLAISFAAMGLVFEVGLRLAGYEAIYEVYSKPSLLWREDPLLGWHHQPNRSDLYVGPRPWPVEFETPIQINSLGLRGPEVVPLPPGERRILFLGDSVVAGFEVRQEETFVHLSAERAARALGAPVQGINAGVRGYGTDQSLLWYRSRGRGLRPDLVVFVHSLNDTRNNVTLHRQRRPFGKPAFALRPGGRSGSLELVGSPVPSYPLCAQVGLDPRFEVARQDGAISRLICGFETRLADHSALFTFVTYRLRQSPALLLWLRSFGRTRPSAAASRPPGLEALRLATASLTTGVAHAASPLPDMAQRYALTSRLLIELAREVRKSGARLLILIRESELDRMDADAIHAEGALTRTLVISETLSRGRPVKFVNDGHFNALGHRLSAALLAPVLVDLLTAEADVSGGASSPEPDPRLAWEGPGVETRRWQGALPAP